MIVVSDTSAISNLILIDKLSLLKEVFGEVIIPNKVYSEIIALESLNINLTEFKSSIFIFTKKISDIELFNKLILNLDDGESEAIVLAKELNADFLLIDEVKGRKVARDFNLKIIGLIGVLLKAKEMKLIPNIKNILDELKINAGFWISEDLYFEILKISDE